MRLLLLALVFVLVGIGIGVLISAAARSGATRGGQSGPSAPPPPSGIGPGRPSRGKDATIRRLIGGLLLIAAAAIAFGYAYYSG